MNRVKHVFPFPLPADSNSNRMEFRNSMVDEQTARRGKMSGLHVAGHLSADEIKMKMQMSAGFLKFQKWLVIYNVLVDPRPISEIAKHTGLSESSVYRIISEYNDDGPDAIDTMRKMGTHAWFGHRATSFSV